MTHKEIKITASASPSDPRVCAFDLSVNIFDGSALCSGPEQAKGSPLFERLFALAGVSQVWAAGHRVTVACDAPQPWETAARAVGRAIREALADPRPPVSSEFRRAPEGDLAARIRTILQAEINPSLASHGGSADLVEVADGVAHVRLSGGCQGCGAAQMTLTQGIERILRARVPELRGVRDVTDHEAGQRPYFAKEIPGRSPLLDTSGPGA